MAFDPTVYAQLNAASPEAAAAYLASETAFVAAAPSTSAPAPQAQFTPPPSSPQLSQFAPAPGTQAQQPQPELARGTLEDFYNQPQASNGGKGASQYFGSYNKGNKKPQGSWLHFRVDRDITNADVSQLTDTNNVPQTWKFGPQAGKPKFQLTVPGTVLGSGDGTHDQFFEGGALRLYLKPGPVTDAFRAALQAGGENSGFPKAGSEIVMISAGEKANKGNYSPTQLYEFRYTAPNGQAAEVPAAPAAAPAPVALPVAVPPTSPVPATPAAQPQVPAVSTPTEAASGKDAEKAALLAQLQGLGG